MSKKKKILIAAVVILLAACGLYSRPVMLLDLCPMLSLDKCTGIQGYYQVGTQETPTEFTIERDSEEFRQLFTQFYWKEYRRSFRDIFPRSTRYHQADADDFRWEVHFRYENVELPDGSGGSGEMLRFENWYGELDIFFIGESHFYFTSNQEEWSENVLNIIQQAG